MIKKKLFKYSSVLLCAAMMACSLAACGAKTASNEQNATVISQAAGNDAESTISNAIYSQILTTSAVAKKSTTKNENTKEETVYVFADANGSQNHLLINEKLRNVTGLSSIQDVSSLKNIKNLTGDETSSASGNFLTWAADGNSITYQGTSSDQVPVTMKVTYYLNGSEITAKNLAGKSGKVTMKFEYTNNAKKSIKVNGKTKTAYVPFTMITGMLLPTDKFTNIEVTNGKVVEANDNNVVLGVTMPGLNDSLNISLGGEALGLDIPESFEVTADVKDFELDMTMSVATSNLLSDMNLDSLSIGDVSSKVNEITDAANKLQDGSGELSDNLNVLAGKIPELTDGVAALNSGASQVADGAATLSDYSSQIAAGLTQASTGANAYTDGVAQSASGASDLDTKMGLYSSAVDNLYATLKDTQKFDQNVAALTNGANQLYQGIISTEPTGLAGSMLNGMSAQKTSYEAAYKAGYDYIFTLKTGGYTPEQLKAANETQYNALVAGLEAAGIYADPDIAGTITDQQNNHMNSLVAALVSAYAPQAAGDTTKAVVTDIVGKIVAITQYDASYKTLAKSYSDLMGSDLVTGAKDLADNMKLLNDGIGSFATYKEGTLCSSIYGLKVNADLLQKDGTLALKNGLAYINSKSSDLTSGLATLSQKTGLFSDNMVNLAGATTKVSAGASELNSKTGTLADGVNALNEGALTLKNGMIQFNDEGISKITEILGTDAKDAVETIKQVVQLGNDYQSFAGKSDDVDGTVKFIYKTEGITK